MEQRYKLSINKKNKSEISVDFSKDCLYSFTWEVMYR